MLVIHRDSPSAARPEVHVGDLGPMAGQMLADAIAQSIQKTGRCRLGLAGGTTPAPVYAWLRAHLPQASYRGLQVTWCDERLLPAAPRHPGDWQAYDPEHNLRAAYAEWLAHVPLPPEQVLPLTLGGAPAAECVRFGRAFAEQFAGGLDIALLGVGGDGHIASLFPEHPALDLDDLCLLIHNSPKPPAERLTLALPTLNRAGQVVVLATGRDKGQLLAQVWRGQREELPVARLSDRAVSWLVDAAAGRELAAAALE
ncbi:MAG: 6-phosphogluconolactonase [Deltaproteobacteria bacterium]|nr:6-phosphogluconolactonase [Deltaproteobacteria bacterium]